MQEHTDTKKAAVKAGGGEESSRPVRSVSFGEDRVLEIDANPVPEAVATRADGSPTPRSPANEDEVLKEGWEVSVSESTGQRYYHHPATGKSQWEPPLASDSSSSSLPEPWEERMSSSKQEVYFFNTITGESVWERPGSDASQNPDQECKPNSGTAGGAERHSRFPTLPQPWEERRSSSTQKVYYFNPTTGESVWERPDINGSNESRARGRARGSGAGMFACCAAPTSQH